MSDEPFRVALIGYGLGGAVFHAPFIAAARGLRLACVVTRDAGRAAQARREHPGVRVLETPDLLWREATAFDLVVISTPNRTHVPLASAALSAGLSVVVDKPFAATAEAAERVIREAREQKLLLTVYHNRRWDGDFLTVRRLVNEGALGDVLRFESRFERWRPLPKAGWRESTDPEDAGGLLFDLGTHLIDQALVLFGPVDEVYAEVDRRRGVGGADDDVFVALTHASGVRSHLWTTVLAAQPGPRFRVLGSRGTYTKDFLDPQEESLRAGVGPQSDDFGIDPADRWGVLSSGDANHAVPTERGAYARFYEAVVDALRGEAPSPVDPRDAVAVLDIIHAARRSSAEKRVVRMGDGGPNS